MEILNGQTFALLALAVGLSYGLTWVARIVAPSVGLVDRPDGTRKLHAQATPLMGGIAIFLAIVGVWLTFRFIGVGWLERSHLSSLNVALLTSAGLFCLIGLWDDKWSMRPRNKFVLQIAGTLPFVLYGRSMESIQFFGNEIPLGIAGVAFTILWLVACSNAINLLDGLDGLAGAVGFIALLTIGVLSILHQEPVVAVFAFVAAASIVGFLVHNWHPARIFLGDAGSLTIGFLIGAVSLEALLTPSNCFPPMAPLFILCVPVFDTLIAILRRKLDGRGIGHPDRGHIHHRMLKHGLSPRQALVAIASMCLLTAGAAIGSASLSSDLLGCIACFTLVGFLVSKRIFGFEELVLLLHKIRPVRDKALPSAQRPHEVVSEVAQLEQTDEPRRERQRRAA